MTTNGFIVRNRKLFVGTGIALSFASSIFMRASLSLNFVPLQNGATVKDAASDLANSFSNPWVTGGSIAGWIGILFVVIGWIGMVKFDKGVQK